MLPRRRQLRPTRQTTGSCAPSQGCCCAAFLVSFLYQVYNLFVVSYICLFVLVAGQSIRGDNRWLVIDQPRKEYVADYYVSCGGLCPVPPCN